VSTYPQLHQFSRFHDAAVEDPCCT